MSANQENEQIAKLQDALLEGKIDQETYERLKADLQNQATGGGTTADAHKRRLVPLHFAAGIAANVLIGLICFLDAFGRESGPDFGDVEMFGAGTLALWLGIFSAAGRVRLAYLAWIFGAMAVNASMKDSEYADTHDIGWISYVTWGLIGAIGAQVVYSGGKFLHGLITPEDN